MPFNNMLKTRIDLLKLRALTETDNYINVSHQLEVETQRFYDSLEGKVSFNNELVKINTQNNGALLYTTVAFLASISYKFKEVSVLLCSVVNTEVLTDEQKSQLMQILLLSIGALVNYSNRTYPMLKEILRKINNFLKYFDMRKYNID